MTTMEAIDLWIESLEINPAEVWGPLEELAAKKEVNLDYLLEEFLV